jgi:outer membrane autotransporter protein
MLSAATFAAGLTGYGGRRAYAACVAGTPPTFVCSGANAAQQTINLDDATASTVAGFSVNTAAGDAISITGDGALSYTDDNASPLTATSSTGHALFIRSGGDIGGGNAGSVSVITSGTLVGGYGIYGYNHGSGSLTITANGDVTGTAAHGLAARNYGTTSTVTTAAGTTISGDQYGIAILNPNGGSVTITANGDVTGTTGAGIYGASAGGSVNITVGAASHVTSHGTASDKFGIYIRFGIANVTIAGTVNGGAGGAIEFSSNDARLELQPTAVINGNVLAGPGTNDTLAFGGTGNGAFNLGNIDTGANTQQYQGFDTFKVESGTWSFSGTTTEPFTVTGGRVMGTGTFGGLTVSGGTIAPGNSIGTLNVAGNVSFAPGTFYQVEINAAGQSDLIAATGTATLTGGTVQVLPASGTYVPNTRYTILTAASGVTGTFDGATISSLFFVPTLSYDATDVFLTLSGNSVTLASVAQTPNELAVANALDQLPSSNPLAAAVLDQSTIAGTLQALNALSGEVYGTLPGVFANQSLFVRDVILARLLQAYYSGGGAPSTVALLGNSGPTTVAALGDAPMMGLGMGARDYDTLPALHANGLTFWTQGFGSWGQFDGNGNAATADRSLGGFLSGVDAGLGGGWRAGLATGYTQTSVSVNQRLSSADINSYNLVGYAGGSLAGVALRAAGAWTWHGIDSSRTVLFPGFFESERASYNGDTGQIFGEAALPMGTGATALEPFAGLAYVHVSTGGFTESGAVAGLNSGGSSDDLGYFTLGGRAAALLLYEGTQVTPHAAVAWQHAFGDTSPGAALAFNSNGVGFGITGVPIAQDTALIEAGLDVQVAPQAVVSLSYQGQLAGDLQDNGIRGNVDWRF